MSDERDNTQETNPAPGTDQPAPDPVVPVASNPIADAGHWPTPGAPSAPPPPPPPPPSGPQGPGTYQLPPGYYAAPPPTNTYPPQYAPYTMGGMPSAQNPYSAQAITGFVLSIVGLVFLFAPPLGLAAIPGVILGHLSLGQIAKRRLRGRGLALAAIIVGYSAIAIGLLILAFLIFAVAVSSGYNDTDCVGRYCTDMATPAPII